jgi:hypothetical protein
MKTQVIELFELSDYSVRGVLSEEDCMLFFSSVESAREYVLALPEKPPCRNFLDEKQVNQMLIGFLRTGDISPAFDAKRMINFEYRNRQVTFEMGKNGDAGITIQWDVYCGIVDTKNVLVSREVKEPGKPYVPDVRRTENIEIVPMQRVMFLKNHSGTEYRFEHGDNFSLGMSFRSDGSPAVHSSYIGIEKKKITVIGDDPVVFY